MINLIIAIFGMFLIIIGVYAMSFGFDTPPNFLFFFLGLIAAVFGFIILIISKSKVKFSSSSKRLSLSREDDYYQPPQQLSLRKREYYDSKPKKRPIKGIITIFLLIIIIGVGFFGLNFNSESNSTGLVGEHKILVLSADPSEKRPGMGAVDMAFIFTVKDGEFTNITSIYPHKMAHPTEPAPLEVQKQGVAKMLLHDSLWYNDTEQGSKFAQEIVEYNTGIKTDIVVIFNVESIDAIVNSIGPLYVEGVGYVNGSTLDFLREEQDDYNYTRGQAVKSLMSSISNSTKQDKTKYLTLIETVSDQYKKGNIAVYPSDAFPKLIMMAESHDFSGFLF
ncbi:MAG: DUF4012 domain-containing protein [Methanomicrobiales archaeon]